MRSSPLHALLSRAALLAVSLLAPLRAQEQAARPNVLFFLVDDMGTQDTSEPFLLGAQGRPVRTANNARYRTPNLERLARQGLKFTAAYACSVCTPTRVSLLTGQNSARHHVTTWTHPDVPQDTGDNQERTLRSPDWRRAGVDETDVTLPRLLHEAGYRTIHCGKAHFGSNGTFGGDPRDVGFDVNIAGHGAGGPGSYLGLHDFSAAWRGGGTMWDVPGLAAYHGEDVFLTEALTREMKRAIADAVEDGVPFFAYMAHYAVHAPFEVDARFAADYPELSGNDLAFATMVAGMDRSLGDLLEHLRELGVAERTLVVFFSDNGSDGPPNLPLRGKKGMRWEGGVRVPLVFAWARPDDDAPVQRALPIPRDAVEDDVVVCEDLFATVAAVTDLEVPRPVDGVDLTPYLRGEPGTHRPQRFLLHFPHGHNHDHFTVYREGPWKVVYSYGPEQWELYDLAADPFERTNLATDEPARALELAQGMVRALADADAQPPLRAETGEPVTPNLRPLEDAQELTAPWERTATIELPEVRGRIDHLAVDLARERLYVAALGNDSVEVVDLAAGRWLRRLPVAREPQGILFLPDEQRLVVTSGGAGTCEVFDAATLERVAAVPVGDDADNARYDARSRRVLVACDGKLSVLDAATWSALPPLPLSGGHPEGFQLDLPRSRALVNVPSGRAVVALDLARGEEAERWDLPDVGANFPLALAPAAEGADEPDLCLVGCRSPATLLVRPLRDGATWTALALSGDVDDLFYDARRRRVLAACGEGFLDTFEREAAGLSGRRRVATAPGARTCLYVPERDRLYVAAPRRDGAEARVLVFAPRD